MASLFAKNVIYLLRLKQSLRGNVPAPILPKSLLFIELTRLGDVVAMLPALQSFHDAWPGAKLSIAVESRYAPLFGFLPWVNAVHAFNDTKTVRGLLEARAILRKGSFDLIGSMSPAIRNAFLTLGTSSPIKIGYLSVSQSLTPFLDRSELSGTGIDILPVGPYHREHIARRSGKICEALGIPYSDHVRWSIPEKVKEAARARLSLSDSESGRPLIVMHPYAGWAPREWSIDRYVSLGRKLSTEFTVVITGMPDELTRSGMAEHNGTAAGIRIFETSNIAEFAALLSQASLYIGSDSGPLHLASSLGVPCIGLFGPSDPDYTAPIGPRNRTLYHRMDCSPCRQLNCPNPGRNCMDAISEQEAFDAINQVLCRETAQAQ